MQVTAVIVAGGRGERFGRKKQFLRLYGKPLLYWSLDTFQKIKEIREIVLVLPQEDLPEKEKIIKEKFNKVKKIVPGGRTRQESVFNGLRVTDDKIPFVAIHDGVRPLASEKLVKRTLETARKYGSAVAALPVRETLKLVGKNNLVERTLPREKIWAIQTPQVFPRNLLLKAYEKAQKDKFTGTDDAQLVERIRSPVKLVLGEETNIKVTTPEDLLFAETILRSRRKRSIANARRFTSFVVSA